MKSDMEYAEEVIKSLITFRDKWGNVKGLLTVSQIRNILAMSADIYNSVLESPTEDLLEDLLDRISYLTVRLYYEAGRNQLVKKFIEKAKLIEKLKNAKTKKDYVDYYHYMEALVAFHRYYGGKDQ